MDVRNEAEGATRSVQIIYFDGCPHWQTALHRLKVALEQVGPHISIQVQLVTNEIDAKEHHMAGSPTILIDGRDPFPGGGPAWGCRLYPGEGGMEGSPSLSDLLEVLG